jgi:uncharacterized protein YjbI with pentapeptide repeats
MADPRHLELLSPRGTEWLRFRLAGERLDLRGADLAERDLSGVYLNDGDLRETRLAAADLTRAHTTRSTA